RAVAQAGAAAARALAGAERTGLRRAALWRGDGAGRSGLLPLRGRDRRLSGQARTRSGQVEDRRSRLAGDLLPEIAPRRGGRIALGLFLGGDGIGRRQLAARRQAGALSQGGERSSGADQVALPEELAGE